MLTRRSMGPLFVASAVTSGGLLAAVRAERRGQAPEFMGIDIWLNTETPLTVVGLRGKVVLVDFWTYSCINCRRTIPYLNRWQAEYEDAGLQVVGIHTPEFGFERAHRNVETSVKEFGIRYPVGQDNRFQTWQAWENQAWPAFYLLDKAGRIVLVRQGEGHAAELEAAIRALLGLPGAGSAEQSGDDRNLSRVQSPEIYFGANHFTPQDTAQAPSRGEVHYAFPTDSGPKLNQYQLDGTWAREDEALVLRSSQGKVRMNFSAAKIHFVAAASPSAAIKIRVDNEQLRQIEVERPTLYTLYDGSTYGEHTVELEANRPGLTLYSATFG